MYGKKLRELRKLEGWTQEEVAKKLGITKQTYSHYENETRRPSLEMIRQLAAIYNVNIDDIFADEVKKVENMVNIPIVGRISCGNGSLAYEEIEGYWPVPREFLTSGEYFFLRASGDSMSGARIEDGDLVLIRKQETVENGEIAAVLIGDEAVLKKVFFQNGTMILQSANPNYPPIVCPPAEARILGKMVMNVIKFD